MKNVTLFSMDLAKDFLDTGDVQPECVHIECAMNLGKILESGKMIEQSLHEYENLAVVNRYCKDYNKSIEYGMDVFRQLLKWLYISNRLKLENIPAFMTPELVEIDNMWHVFIFFTKDYEAFCMKYFDCFIHHTPAEAGIPDIQDDKKREIFRKYFELIVKEFGTETLYAWFREKKYGHAILSCT